jgi:hypothetical protein
MPLFDRNMDFKIPQVSWKRQRPLFMRYSPWGDTWKIRRDTSSGTAGTLCAGYCMYVRMFDLAINDMNLN